MSTEREKRIFKVYKRALDLDSVERNDFLNSACAGDEGIRAEVDSLLHHADLLENDESFERKLFSNIANHAVQFLKDKEEQTQTAPSIDMRLGHYRLARKIGEGGMGVVYQAEDCNLKRMVAIKLIAEKVAEQPGIFERFRREGKALAALDHPNIVRIHAVEEHYGLHFLVMEWLEGRTLDQLIPKRGMELEEFLRYAIPLTDAIGEAHKNSVIHRDIKPGNVMITHEGTLKILDFGLAKSRGVEEKEDLSAYSTRQGFVLGTYPYMSPEQLRGQECDGRSDIFSLGVILYQMATGSRPFEGETSSDLVSSILRDQPKPILQRNHRFPEQLSLLIEHCLEKEPNNRTQSCLDLHYQLKDVLQGASTTPPGVFIVKPQMNETSFSLMRKVAEIPAKRFMAPLFFIAILLLTFYGLHHYRSQSTTALGDLIYIGPFNNLTNDPALHNAESFVADLMREAHTLRLFKPKEEWETEGYYHLAELCGQNDIPYLVTAFLTRSENGYRINADLLETGDSGKTHSFEYDFQRANQFQNVAGRLVYDIRAKMGERAVYQPQMPILENPKAMELFAKGLSYLHHGRVDNAFFYYESALELEPEFVRGIAKFALLKQSIGRDDAVAEIEKAIALKYRLSRDDMDFLAVEGIHAMVTRDYEKGKKVFKKYTRQYPNNAFGHRQLANAYSIMGEGAAFLRSIEKAIERNSDALHEGLRVFALLETNQYPEALDHYLGVRREFPEDGYPLWGGALTYLILEDWEQLDATLSLMEEDGEDYLNHRAKHIKGQMLLIQGNFEEASAFLLQGISPTGNRELVENQWLCRILSARVHLLLGMPDEALDDIRDIEYVKPEPDLLFLIKEAALIAIEARSSELAEICLQKLEAIQQKYPHALTQGLLLYVQGMQDLNEGKPLDVVRNTLKEAYLSWRSPDVWSAYARVLAESGEHVKAISMFKQIIGKERARINRDLNPDVWIRTLHDLSQSYQSMGNSEKAKFFREKYNQYWPEPIQHDVLSFRLR